MSEERNMSWAAKVGKGSTSTPHLKNIPPTTEAFIENVKRAHIQASVWKPASHSAPPLHPLNHGFISDTSTKSLLPRALPEDVPLAPENILKRIRCSCETDTPCKTMRCIRCASAKLPCTVFCKYHADDCYNHLTKSKEDD